MACAILGLQTVNNLAIVVLTQRTEGEKSFDRWTAILHIVDILCCCAVLIPIVWQVNALEKIMDRSNGGMAAAAAADDNDDENIREEEFDEGSKPRDGRLVGKLKSLQ